MKRFVVLTILGAIVAFLALFGGTAEALTDCTFTTSGSTMSLDADCTTDATIFVPDGVTLDGGGNAITAVDPPAGHFVGGVIENAGAVAHVTGLVVNTSSLANVCDGGGDRLRGIMFDGASGSITHNTVLNINQGPSGCQEGNGIEVRNAPFDGAHPATKTVEIGHNHVERWQKTGIVANGDVDVRIHHNVVGVSATEQNLAPNGVQVGFGAIALVELNHVAGNRWLGPSNFAGTGVLAFCADAPTIRRNNIGGNADVGVFLVNDNARLNNNRVFENGDDGLHGDFGIVNFACTSSGGNEVTNNKVRGYDTPVAGDPTTGTVNIPSPHDAENACFFGLCNN